MLSKLLKQSFKHCYRTSYRSITTAGSPKTLLKNYKKLILLGGFTSLACFDYFVRDAEGIGGAIRFGRSLKIAAVISADYNFGLGGLDENSEVYDTVRESNLVKKLFLDLDLHSTGDKRDSSTFSKSAA